MKTIALIAQKGGTGKTTLAVCLAVAAQEAGKQTLIIDLDPQASACKWADRRGEESSIIVIDAQPGRLEKALQKAREGGIELAIIDTPGKSEQSALAAAAVADLVIIAIRPQVYDIETIPDTKRIIALAGGRPAVVVFNQIPPPAHEGVSGRYQEAVSAIETYGISAAPNYICSRVAFGDSAIAGQAPSEYQPEGRAALEINLLYKYISSLLYKSKSKGVGNHEQEAKSRSSVG